MDHDMGESGHWIEYDIGAGTLGLGRYAGWKPTGDGCTRRARGRGFRRRHRRRCKAAGTPFNMEPVRNARLPHGHHPRSRRQPAHHPQAQARPPLNLHPSALILSPMAILVDTDTRILVQGITGDFGSRHAKLSLDYGTQLVAGVTPGKGGQIFEHGGHKVPDLRHRRRGREARPAPPSAPSSFRRPSPPTPSSKASTPGSISPSPSPRAFRSTT